MVRLTKMAHVAKLSLPFQAPLGSSHLTKESDNCASNWVFMVIFMVCDWQAVPGHPHLNWEALVYNKVRQNILSFLPTFHRGTHTSSAGTGTNGMS